MASEMRRDLRKLARTRLIAWMDRSMQVYAMGDMKHRDAVSDLIVILLETAIANGVHYGLSKADTLVAVSDLYDHLMKDHKKFTQRRNNNAG